MLRFLEAQMTSLKAAKLNLVPSVIILNTFQNLLLPASVLHLLALDYA
jgi:hypothetical protein